MSCYSNSKANGLQQGSLPIACFSQPLTISWSGHFDLSHSKRASFLKAPAVPLWVLCTAAMVAAFLTISIIPGLANVWIQKKNQNIKMFYKFVLLKVSKKLNLTKISTVLWEAGCTETYVVSSGDAAIRYEVQIQGFFLPDWVHHHQRLNRSTVYTHSLNIFSLINTC